MIGAIKCLLPILVVTSVHSDTVSNGPGKEIDTQTLLIRLSEELAIQRSKIAELEERDKIQSSKIAILEEMLETMEYRSGNRSWSSHTSASMLEKIPDDHRIPRGVLPSSPIAFYAYMSRGFSNVPSYTQMVYDAVITNEGRGYDSTSGIFTAPISGFYAFSWVIEVSGRNPVGTDLGEISIEIIQSGHSRGSVHADSELDYDDDTATGFVILSVHAGEPVYLRSTDYSHNQGSFISSEGHGRWSFAGFRIG